MNIEILVNYFIKYGLAFIFIIIFLEHLNFPGIPGTLVMPTIGMLAAKNNSNIILIILISICAAILGSIVLYIIGYLVGAPILEWINKKVPKTQKYTDKIINYSNKYGNKAVFVCRLLPVVRVLVSLISGVLKMEFFQFILYSAGGIAVWNFIFIASGYFSTKVILK